MAELNRRREDVWRGSRDRVRALLPLALDVLQEALAARDRRAALALLKLAGLGEVNLGQIGLTDGATIVDSQVCERACSEQRRAEAEVRAAECEADLEIRRVLAGSAHAAARS
jgi:hypothetical protein